MNFLPRTVLASWVVREDCSQPDFKRSTNFQSGRLPRAGEEQWLRYVYPWEIHTVMRILHRRFAHCYSGCPQRMTKFSRMNACIALRHRCIPVFFSFLSNYASRVLVSVLCNYEDGGVVVVSGTCFHASNIMVRSPLVTR